MYTLSVNGVPHHVAVVAGPVIMHGQRGVAAWYPAERAIRISMLVPPDDRWQTFVDLLTDVCDAISPRGAAALNEVFRPLTRDERVVLRQYITTGVPPDQRLAG